MKFRELVISEETYSHLEAIEARRKLAFQLSYQQFQAITEVVKTWDAAAPTEFEALPESLLKPDQVSLVQASQVPRSLLRQARPSEVLREPQIELDQRRGLRRQGARHTSRDSTSAASTGRRSRDERHKDSSSPRWLRAPPSGLCRRRRTSASQPTPACADDTDEALCGCRALFRDLPSDFDLDSVTHTAPLYPQFRSGFMG